MSGQAHWYLIIYDIRCPRRLQRVHRLLRQCAYPLQESVFAWQGGARELADLQTQLRKRIKPSVDDVRGYRLARGAKIALWGQSPFTAGIYDSGRPPHRHYTGADWTPRPEADFPLPEPGESGNLRVPGQGNANPVNG